MICRHISKQPFRLPGINMDAMSALRPRDHPGCRHVVSVFFGDSP